MNFFHLVIDSCFVKLRCYNPHSSTDSLVVVTVSQASAEQRAGRAGRVRSGKAYRLCTGILFYCYNNYMFLEINAAALIL